MLILTLEAPKKWFSGQKTQKHKKTEKNKNSFVNCVLLCPTSYKSRVGGGGGREEKFSLKERLVQFSKDFRSVSPGDMRVSLHHI